jgi:hypothetical protein
MENKKDSEYENPIITAYIDLPFQMIDGEMKIYNEHAVYQFSQDQNMDFSNKINNDNNDCNHKTYTIAHVKMPFQLIDDEIQICDEDAIYTFSYTDELPEKQPQQNTEMINKIIELVYGNKRSENKQSENKSRSENKQINDNNNSESDTDTTLVIPYKYNREPKLKSNNTTFKNRQWKRNKTAKNV